MKLILKICQNFVKNFDKIEEKNSLFTGKNGIGKTFYLAVLPMNC